MKKLIVLFLIVIYVSLTTIIMFISGCSTSSNSLETDTKEATSMNTLSEETTTEYLNSNNNWVVYGTNLSNAESVAGFEFSGELPKTQSVRAIKNKIIEVECLRSAYNENITDDSSVYLRKALSSEFDDDGIFSEVYKDDLYPVMANTEIGGTYLCDNDGNIIVVNFSDGDFKYAIHCADTEQGMKSSEAEYLMNVMLGTKD